MYIQQRPIISIQSRHSLLKDFISSNVGVSNSASAIGGNPTAKTPSFYADRKTPSELNPNCYSSFGPTKVILTKS